jgi:hypothetical protein
VREQSIAEITRMPITASARISKGALVMLTVYRADNTLMLQTAAR